MSVFGPNWRRDPFINSKIGLALCSDPNLTLKQKTLKSEQNESKAKRVPRVEVFQARIAQLVAFQLGTGKVPGSNPGKGVNFAMKISY